MEEAGGKAWPRGHLPLPREALQPHLSPYQVPQG